MSAATRSTPATPASDSDPTWPALTLRLMRGEDLSAEGVAWAMGEVMTGSAVPVQLAGFLVALGAKGVRPHELGALADTMLEHAGALRAPDGAVDIVGTGGDMHHTVNISTMAALVIAATGRPVVKHGNRASSSKSGSADVLEELGVRLDMSIGDVERMAHEVGITFCFAQVFHPSMRHAVEARRGLALPTVFNVLGPITNPGRVQASAVGVADAAMAPVVAEVFASRGTSALVFRGREGLDELSVSGPSDLWEVTGGRVHQQVLDPSRDLDLDRHDLEALRGGTAAQNASIAREVFAGAPGAARDAVVLNAAAGIVAADAARTPTAPEEDTATPELVPRLRRAMDEARRALDDGAVETLLDRWAQATAATRTDDARGNDGPRS
ncbi:MAG: anthranilate phosphoribosyltransferase [Brachybacterium sp.]|nr:anthranilate phosphoribosyltransferase [Brachybacterium sp.]